MSTVVYRYALRKVAGSGQYANTGSVPKVRCGGCGKKHSPRLAACPGCGSVTPPGAALAPQQAECACGHCGDGPVRCLGRDRGRYELPGEVAGQLEKTWAFRQDLVAIERGHQAALGALWSEKVPGAAEAEAVIEAAGAEVARLEQEAADSRSARVSTAAGPAAAKRLREARARVEAARGERRRLIREHSPALAAELAGLKRARADAIRECRQAHAERGLAWGSYTMALTDHGVAVKLVARRRAIDPSAELRYRPHDGTGTIAVQLQRVCAEVTPQERARTAALLAGGHGAAAIAAILASEGFPARPARSVARMTSVIAAGKPAPQVHPVDPPRSPGLIASGTGKWANVFRLSPWMPPQEHEALSRGQRRELARTGEAVLAVGGGRTVLLPVAVHRMIPAGAEIVAASLTVTRLAGQWDAALNVTVHLPLEPAGPGAAARPAVALHSGWRSRGDGSVRVATWASQAPLAVPARLAAVCVPSGDGRHGEVIVPAAWMERAGYPAAVRSLRDQALAPVRAELAAWLGEHPQDGMTAEDVSRHRSPGRLGALAAAWRDAPPDGGQEITALLEKWRARDRHLWEIEAHDRDQTARRRDDAWRCVAAWLASAAGLIITDGTDLAKLRRRPGEADDDPPLPVPAQRRARARAALSAPSRLRRFTGAAAARRGVTTATADTRFLSRTCPRCRHVSQASAQFAAAAVVTCGGCGEKYDQDISAATLMLSRAAAGSEPGPAPAGTPAP